MMSWREIQLLSSGPYHSQSARYWNPRPRRCTFSNRRTVHWGWPSTSCGGGGAGDAGISGLEGTGLIFERWKTGCTRREEGRLSHTVAGFRTWSILKGPT